MSDLQTQLDDATRMKGDLENRRVVFLVCLFLYFSTQVLPLLLITGNLIVDYFKNSNETFCCDCRAIQLNREKTEIMGQLDDLEENNSDVMRKFTALVKQVMSLHFHLLVFSVLRVTWSLLLAAIDRPEAHPGAVAAD